MPTAAADPIPYHVPVLAAVVQSWAAGSTRAVDATLGGGGHAAILRDVGALVLGIDRDPDALGAARARLGAEGVEYLEGSFAAPAVLAVVKAFHRGTEVVLASQATGPDDSYVIEGLTQGEYELGVSTAEGIYLVADAVRFDTGQKRAASFALQRGVQEQEQPPVEEGQEPATADEQKKTEEPQQTEPEKKKDKKATKLKRPRGAAAVRTPLVATGIVVGAAIVIGAVASNLADDGDGSPN